MRRPAITASRGLPPTATSTRSSRCWPMKPRPAPGAGTGQGPGVSARDPGRHGHPRRPVPPEDPSVRGEAIDLCYSGKAHAHGGNIQAVMAPDGFPLWVSEVEPGSVHDITAAPCTPCPRSTRPPRPGCPPWLTPVMTAPASAYTSRSSSHPAGRSSYRYPHRQRAAPLAALPGRTRVRPAHRPLAHPPAHHRQPLQDRRYRPRRPRPDPFRARLHQMKIAEITSLCRARTRSEPIYGIRQPGMSRAMAGNTAAGPPWVGDVRQFRAKWPPSSPSCHEPR